LPADADAGGSPAAGDWDDVELPGTSGGSTGAGTSCAATDVATMAINATAANAARTGTERPRQMITANNVVRAD
jgi:hypothetical protein